MTTTDTNTPPAGNFLAGPPMVRIDGAEVRRIREERGLTQLYVATVVQVTTDTISRWENRRYPSIKKENAEKLAEALGVELADLLEREVLPATPEGATPGSAQEMADPETSTPPALPLATPKRRYWVWLAGGLLAALALFLWFRFFAVPGHEPLPAITATRTLPNHVPPGQEFPVLLRVAAPTTASFALIVRENLPAGCRLTGATPAATAPTGRSGQISWVSRLEGRERLFAYRLTTPLPGQSGPDLRFHGQVVAGGQGETTTITGPEQLRLAPYHWADLNGDNRIDDEEILWVYDQIGDVEGFDRLRDEVDRIWTAGGYRWDAASGHYQVRK
jgi:transcriptional regulator with XRE-family HTH domain